LLIDSRSDFLAKTIREVNAGKVVIAPELFSELWRSSVDPLNEKEKILLMMAHQGIKSIVIAKK